MKLALSAFLVVSVTVQLAFGQARVTPEDTITPGVTRDDMTEEQIRQKSWGKDRRAVTTAIACERLENRFRLTPESAVDCADASESASSYFPAQKSSVGSSRRLARN
jgi:hypothetical protein